MMNAEWLEEAHYDQLVASNVRAELARERWTGRQAALALGVTVTYVSRRLSGRTPMTPSDLKMFADLIGISIAKFFELPAYRGENSPSRGGLGLSLPDLDSNQEPPHSSLAPVSQLELHRAAKLQAHSAVRSDRDGTVLGGAA